MSKFQLNSKKLLVLTILVIAALCYALSFDFSRRVDFNAEVRPIINNKCIACHGGVKKSGGFSLLFREEALGKTKSGKPAIIPGHPNKSEFIHRLRSTDPEQRMPLEKDPLTEQEIAILENGSSKVRNGKIIGLSLNLKKQHLLKQKTMPLLRMTWIGSYFRNWKKKD
jgi:hypothetical protein